MAARALSLLALASAAHAFAPAHKSKFHPIRTVGSASICSGAGGEGAAATGSCVPAPLTGRIYAQVHARRGRRVLRRARKSFDLWCIASTARRSTPSLRHGFLRTGNEKDPLKRFTDEHRAPVLNEVMDRGVHVCTKQGSEEIIRAAARRRRLLGLH